MNKLLIRVISIIPVILFIFIWLLVYEYLKNNNMRVCMNHYYDYQYCESVIRGNK